MDRRDPFGPPLENALREQQLQSFGYWTIAIRPVGAFGPAACTELCWYPPIFHAVAGLATVVLAGQLTEWFVVL